MPERSTRSAFVRALAAGAATLGPPLAARGAEPPRVRYMGLQPPGFVLLLDDTMKRFRFDLKHGVNIDLLGYQPSLSGVYNDFVVGNIDFTVGGWDAFAARYLAGAPVLLTHTITTAKAVGIIAQPGITTIAGLAGKTIAALTSSGSFRLVSSALKDYHGFDIQKDATLQNIDNAAQGITLVQAGRADAAISWELFLSIGLNRIPGSRIIYNLGDDLRKNLGVAVPYFSYAVRKDIVERNRGIGGRLAGAYADTVAFIKANLDETIGRIAPQINVPPEALKVAFTSGRFDLQSNGMGNPAARRSVTVASAYLAKNNGLPRALDDGFFAL